MKQIIVLVGPPGSCKTTLAQKYIHSTGYEYVNQDSHGKEGHLEIFKVALESEYPVLIDRMGFNKEQRARYLKPAIDKGYKTKIIVLHQSRSTCLERMAKRENHPIKDVQSAHYALNAFFSKYERPTADEADEIEFIYPDGAKDKVIWSDLDGTLCDVEHRRHFVRGKGKKNWNGFFKEMVNDKVNLPVMETLERFSSTYPIVYCTGRTDNHKKETEQWLKDNNAPTGQLFMRLRNDKRQDDIVKEIILDFEILTRYSVLFCLDDRDQVVKMLRNRGLTVFQVAEGDF